MSRIYLLKNVQHITDNRRRYAYIRHQFVIYLAFGEYAKTKQTQQWAISVACHFQDYPNHAGLIYPVKHHHEKGRNTKSEGDMHHLPDLFLLASGHRWLRCMPRMSMQNDEVRAVMAPSALGNKAEINAMMKMTDTNGGIWFMAMAGNNLSPVSVTPTCSA